MLNFGRLEIETNQSKIHSQTEFDQSSLKIQQLEDLAYANYDVKLENLEIAIRRREDQKQYTFESHILQLE